MKSNSNNLTGFKKTDFSSTENHHDLHNSYHSLYKRNSSNNQAIDEPCASNNLINGHSSNTSADTLAKYTNIDELTDFKKLCIFNLPESDGYESSTIQEKRELLLAREFGINKEVRKRDEQVDLDIGRENYAADKKKKTKKKKMQKTSSIRRSSSKPSDESANLSDKKEERNCTTPESIEESIEERIIDQKEDLQNGYCSDSLIFKQEDDKMDKGNDSDSSSIANHDLDEMIVVKKKRRNNRMKNSASNATPQPASSVSRSLSDTKYSNLDKQRSSKSKDVTKWKPLKISTTSFDMDQDFPPLTSYPLSATIRTDKNESPSNNESDIHPSKSESDLPISPKKQLQQHVVKEKEPSVKAEKLMPVQTEDLVEDETVQVADEKLISQNLDLEKSEKQVEDKKQPKKEVVKNVKQDVQSNEVVTTQHSDQPASSSSKNRGQGRRHADHRSHSQNTTQTQSSSKYRPRTTNPNAKISRPRYPAYPNYSNNYGFMNQMNIPYVSSAQTMYYSSPHHGYQTYAQLPQLYPHAPTGFVPRQTYLPMHLPFPPPNVDRFQGPSFSQQYQGGYPINANGVSPVIPRSVVQNTMNSTSMPPANEKLNDKDSKIPVEVSPATTPVADYSGHRPPSVPVTVSGIQVSLPSAKQNQKSSENVQTNQTIHQPGSSIPPFSTDKAFVIPSFMLHSTKPTSIVESTMVRVVDNNNMVSPLSQSPDSVTSSVTRPATTTSSSNSDPATMINPPSFPRAIDTITLSPELQQTVREAFGLQPNEGIFYIYATNEKGEHTRQMRVILHNTTQVKFMKFASPVYLSPTVGPVGEFSPAGFYYAKQETVAVPSAEGLPPVVHTVTRHHPVLSFSVTIPEPYQIPLMPTYYPDVLVLPTARKNEASPEKLDPAPSSTQIPPESDVLPKPSSSTSQLSFKSATTSNDTSAQ